MTPEEKIFGEALDLPAAERPAFLDRACGADAALRARVASLLEGYAASDRFLEDSPVSRIEHPVEEQPGDTIGHYTLLKRLGEGGCGVVYLAEQTTPVRRRVALKVIKLGMDTRQIIARFAAERQALALMEHPDIARVFDAGATAAGRPFFVMEFVDGVPITKFCDAHDLAMGARLELFARVCLALQHAHHKGIIHRDVKPSNILVTLRDGVPSPKIIDFGIAKATQGRLTEATLHTGLNQLLGTPAYMSPEQAELREFDIDTRSDVYALGVLLYELLTGRPPFDPKTLIRAGVEEIRRIIREVEPPRPSTLIATLTNADRSDLAHHRGAAPAQLSSVLRGDLDWIVMRCLEKDRDRRYGTAHELADDIRRHLRSEPVNARPPALLYLARKFVLRHRLACASAAALAAALLLGTTVSILQAVRATRAERIAQAERADARRRQEQAEDLLTFMLGDFRTELQKIGRLSLLDSVGDKALAYFASLSPRDLTDTALTRQAKALTQIGEIRLDQARYAEAGSVFIAAYDRSAALAARRPRNADALYERAQAEFWIGFAARRRGDSAAEREWLTHYRDSTAALFALEGKTPRAWNELTSGHHNLAVLELEQGNLSAAEAGFAAERTAVADMLAATPGDSALQFRLAGVVSWLGTVAERGGHYPRALEHFADTAARYAALAAAEPAVARWRYELAQSQTFLANLQALTGHPAAAADTLLSAQTALDLLSAQDPANRQRQVFAQNVRLQRAALLLAATDTPAALALLREATPVLQTLVDREPASRQSTRLLAAAWRLTGLASFPADLPASRTALTRAVALGEPLASDPRADLSALADLAQSLVLAGRIDAAEGSPATAQAHWQRALATLASHLPGTHDWRLLDPAAQAFTLLDQPDSARPLLDRLRQSGYHSIHPFTAALLAPTFQPNR